MKGNSRPAWVVNAALAGFGLIFALILIGALLVLFPQLRPNTIRFTEAMGDIFYHQAPWMRPPENPDNVLAMYWLEWDADGFRVPHRRAQSYTVVALGDSYTEAPNAAKPWPDVLAEALDVPVRNLGFRGFGPREEMQAFRLYGEPAAVETVIIGFFEGNDLSNAYTSRGKPFSPPSEVTDRSMIPTDFSQITDRDERYPMQIEIDGAVSDIAFLEGYIWALNGTREVFENSRNMALAMRSFRQIREEAPQACVILAYFPDKSHIYLPYLTEEDRPVLLQKTTETVLGEDGQLAFQPSDMLFEAILANLDNQRDAVLEEAAALGLPAVDLTPAFQDAARGGELTYYAYDTHWNQLGHDLAGKVISDFVRSRPCANDR